MYCDAWCSGHEGEQEPRWTETMGALGREVIELLRKPGSSDYYLLVAIYVDDIILESGSLSAIEEAKRELVVALSMTDMGDLKYILSMQIHHDQENGMLLLSQRRYAEFLLRQFQMESCRDIETPLPMNTCLSLIMSPESLSEQHIMVDIPYSNAIVGDD
ncbi:hypothetical protein L7F22_006043 [Adiantum nelumboides]|nr:hypothetical protein [Adiantum nelumboides]